MSHKIKTAIATLIVVLVLYLFQDWLRDFIITGLGGYTTKETVTVTKTKIKIGKVDTTAIFNHYVETKGIILNPKTKTEYITVRDTIRDTIYKKGVKNFNVKIKDSLIDGKINIQNFLNGDLNFANFKYKPLFPKYITRTDTIFKTTTVTEYLSKERSKFGIGLGSDTEFNNLDLLGSFTFKNGLQLIYEYSNPIKDFNVNVPELNFKNFSFPREGNHKVKVLYSF